MQEGFALRVIHHKLVNGVCYVLLCRLQNAIRKLFARRTVGATACYFRFKMQPRVSSLPNPSFSPSDKQRQKMLSGMVWTYILILHGVFCAGSNNIPVSVKEGDLVTLPNDFKITNQDKIRWYFKDTQIAKIDFYNGKSCTDVQCNEGTEGFRDRLKLDHQTGSLTIMNTRSTDSGEYKLEVILAGDDKEESFSVTVLSVSAADRHEMEKNTEEESDTADPGSGLSKAAVAGLCVTVVLLVIGAGAAVICNHKLHARKKVQSGNRARGHNEKMPLESGVATEGKRKDTSLSLLDTDHV